MNKNLFRFLCFFLLCTTSLQLQGAEGSIEVRSAAFFPSSKRFRDIYGDVRPILGLEVTRKSCSCYDTWIDIDVFSKNSHSGNRCHSRATILNTSLGASYVCPIKCDIDAYLGMGVNLAYLRLNNGTCRGKEHISKLGIGVVLKSGIKYLFSDPFFVDCFADYLYQPVHISRHVDIGGIKLGLGIGMNF